MDAMEHPREDSTLQEDPTSTLANLPAYLFFPSLTKHFADPDTSFRRGIFQRINADALDLPPSRTTPNSEQHMLWLHHMPRHFESLFVDKFQSHFVDPLISYTTASREHNTLPDPKLHATKEQYLKLLDRAESSGMISWSIVSEEDRTYSQLANDIQMTLFAVSKSETRSRLISWPRVQNAALPDPPYTSLPNPGMFETIQVNGSHPSAFNLDVDNMFHNITLPTWLAKLFPMQPVPLRQLSPYTRERIINTHPQLKNQEHALVRPCQATMPMGFKWAVYIAHTFASGCLQQAFALYKATRFAPKHLGNVQTLSAEQAPVQLTKATPLILHIIDDITIVTVNWSHDEVVNWHRILRKVLTVHNLPISQRKSCPLNRVETSSVEFIGCLWDLREMRFTPSPEKLGTIVSQASNLLYSQFVKRREFERIIGRISWMATLSRPLLACMQRVFLSDHTNDRNGTIEISDACKKEIRTIIPLLPMAATRINMPISKLLLAFDASLQAGAVTRTFMNDTTACTLWSQAQSAKFNTNLHANDELTAVKLIASAYEWKKLVAHRWKSEEHINALEAAAAVMALECAIRAGVRNSRLIMLTDSLVVLGALTKGRSSSPPLLARCRRFAALALAHNVKVTLAYVATTRNPADRYTREE